MNSEVKLISLIVNHLVYGSDRKELENLIATNRINWKRTKDLIIYHELAPFAYSALKDLNSHLPQDLREALKNSYYCVLFRQLTFESEFLKIAKAFEEQKVTIVPVKGVALIQDVYLKEPPRPMVDIDLLVKEEDISRAESIFCNLGYTKELYGLKEEYWRKSQCHFSFYKKESKRLPIVELHWSLDFKRKNRDILPELWDRIREVNVNGKVVKILSPEDTLFSLALHQRRFGKVLSLKNVLDFSLLFNKYKNNFDWDYVLEESNKGKMCSTIFYFLYCASTHLCVKIPSDVWSGLKISIWKKRLIRNFIDKNTFILKDSNILKRQYLKSHFLLYDSFWEPIEYIINIPKEQFAKFYQLKQYDKKTEFLYKMRLLYMSLNFLGTINRLK